MSAPPWGPVICDVRVLAQHWPELAGLRPSGAAIATSPVRLHLSLLRDLQRVVDLDPEVSDRAFKFAVTKQ